LVTAFALTRPFAACPLDLWLVPSRRTSGAGSCNQEVRPVPSAPLNPLRAAAACPLQVRRFFGAPRILAGPNRLGSLGIALGRSRRNTRQRPGSCCLPGRGPSPCGFNVLLSSNRAVSRIARSWSHGPRLAVFLCKQCFGGAVSCQAFFPCTRPPGFRVFDL